MATVKCTLTHILTYPHTTLIHIQLYSMFGANFSLPFFRFIYISFIQSIFSLFSISFYGVCFTSDLPFDFFFVRFYFRFRSINSLIYLSHSCTHTHTHTRTTSMKLTVQKFLSLHIHESERGRERARTEKY